MTKTRTNKQRVRALNTLLEKGILAICLGLALLVVPLFIKSSTILSAVAGGMRVPGWLALGMGLGLVLLGIHAVTKLKIAASTALPASAAKTLRREPWERPEAWGRGARIDTVEDDSGAHPLRKIAAPSSRTEPTFSTSPAPAPASWSPAVFAAIEWRRFEAVCETLFAQAGFQTRSQSHGADGGVDIWLHSPTRRGQCRWCSASTGKARRWA